MGVSGGPGATGPRGLPGASGPSGQIGQPGTQGDTGSSGDPGPQGFPGPSGSVGQTGQPGVQGQTGPVGDPGTPGFVGAPGLPGSPGAVGTRGPSGRLGATGFPGVIGFPGKARRRLLFHVIIVPACRNLLLTIFSNVSSYYYLCVFHGLVPHTPFCGGYVWLYGCSTKSVSADEGCLLGCRPALSCLTALLKLQRADRCTI